uniref:Uncharacterized protein n=1 Tax=Utricularia reniformis TaxID=192314 RepID=A0A1Y0AZ51_9LAMI|nr:hypothetical protein AEK19_MT2164 [Utricularia reniformis]ART30437.1 hypothetical protein AEK19_MT2164 [Utricularia reniformis]
MQRKKEMERVKLVCYRNLYRTFLSPDWYLFRARAWLFFSYHIDTAQLTKRLIHILKCNLASGAAKWRYP